MTITSKGNKNIITFSENDSVEFSSFREAIEFAIINDRATKKLESNVKYLKDLTEEKSEDFYTERTRTGAMIDFAYAMSLITANQYKELYRKLNSL